MEMQARTVTYVPYKNDPTDAALADYINSRSEPMPVPFTREDKGVYLFGTKRVFIKVENGKIIIRVGGGFMMIDEFVEIYTPLELEKWELSESKESVRHKQVIGKVAQNIAENAGINPNVPDISPQKAARIITKAFIGGSTQYSTFYAVPRKQ